MSKREPRVIASRLDPSQGNPAHLYCYDGVFYLANDRIGGFTRLDPRSIPPGADAVSIDAMAAFHVGGNGHITLAVAGDVAYATWMSRDEADAKRIDVTVISDAGTTEVAYSFDANSGGLHGATFAAGKVFFAPSAGIDWVSVPKSAKVQPSDHQVHHIDLGSDAEKPRRTGAFTTADGHVLFLSGSGESSFLGVIDARRQEPEVNRVPIAFVFHDHPQGAQAANVATVIHLDPNRDGDYSDAKVADQIAVGPSRVEGHGGHHDIAFDASGRFGVIANPGDSTVQVISTSDLSTQVSIPMPFVPGRVVAVGGRGPTTE